MSPVEFTDDNELIFIHNHDSYQERSAINDHIKQKAPQLHKEYQTDDNLAPILINYS